MKQLQGLLAFVERHLPDVDTVAARAWLLMDTQSGQIVQQTPEAMKIETPTAQLGVKGTEFVVHVDGEG